MKIKSSLLPVLLLLAFHTGFGQGLESFFEKSDTFFKTYVSNGKVAYGKIHADPSELHAILELAKGLEVKVSDAKNYQAFWINAYNIAVIKGINDNYPIKSPLSKAGFFDKVNYDVGGKQVTLNDIENKLLRAKFKDARIHFVLVCGAIGCPPLISEAYLPGTLDAQLDEQTRLAINGNFIKVNVKKKKVLGSEILKWYKEDFVREGNEIDYLNKYRDEKIPSEYKLSYFTYDWALNKQ